MSNKVDCDKLTRLVDGVASNPNVSVDNISSLASANNNSISFLSDKVYLPELKKTLAKVLILKEEDVPHWQRDYIVVKDPYLAFAKIAIFFNQTNQAFQTSVHESVVFGNNTNLADEIMIGAHSVIGDNTKIGKQSKIGPNVSIGTNVSIGNESIIHSNVSIEDNVVIGNNCEIFSGARIGADGFGYAQNEKKEWLKIPQTGSVLIEDNVDIGANTTIDRGAIDNTIIKSGVKIDDQVHIGHNCFIDTNTIISGLAGFAGSVRVGKNCMIGGGSRFAPNIKIGDNIVITPTTAITKSLTESGERYTGFMPFLKHRDFMRLAALLKKKGKLNDNK